MKEESRNKPITLYMEKRVNIPILAMIPSFVVGFETGYLVFPFCTYVLSGMFLDWWYFTHKKYKDSDLVSEEQFRNMKIAPQKFDELNIYLVWTRKVAFLASIILTPPLLLWNYPSPDDFKWKSQITFILLYFANTILSITYGVVSRHINYIGIKSYISSGNSEDLPYPVNIIHSPFYIIGSDSPINNPFSMPPLPKSNYD